MNSRSATHAIPRLGPPVVLVRSFDHDWELPGGTREPGKHPNSVLHRELREEIGARFDKSERFGLGRCASEAAAPCRPHIPHPEFTVPVGAVRTRSISTPAGWAPREGHRAMGPSPPADAIEWMERTPGGLAHAGVLRAYVESGCYQRAATPGRPARASRRSEGPMGMRHPKQKRYRVSPADPGRRPREPGIPWTADSPG